MNYEQYKAYVIRKYPDQVEDINFLFECVETIYINNTSPFDLSAEFDKTSKRATNWATRAVMKILEEGELDIQSYSENGLSYTIGANLMSELTGKAGVPK